MNAEAQGCFLGSMLLAETLGEAFASGLQEIGLKQYSFLWVYASKASDAQTDVKDSLHSSPQPSLGSQFPYLTRPEVRVLGVGFRASPTQAWRTTDSNSPVPQKN